MPNLRLTIALSLLCALSYGCADADKVPQTHISAPPAPSTLSTPEKVEQFSLRTALFGDLHVHTSWSADAYSGGNRLGPNSAHRFAKGEKVELAYQHGVPMGSDLASTDALRFWVWATQDPTGPPLDRIQVVTGWVENGEPRQRLWDVVCSGGRTPDAETGKCPKTTAEVNLSTCEPVGTQGTPELQASFADPDYSAQHPAFYYVRVFENPVCSWTILLANSSGSDLPKDVSASVQERGWSSPIWTGPDVN